MARHLETAIGSAFGAGPVPSTGPELVRYAGGRERLVQELTGLPRRPRRSEYTSQGDFEAERRRWTSTQRRVQRWAAPEGKQRRGLVKLPPLPPPVLRRLQRDANARKVEAATARGVRVRMLATILVPSPNARSGGDQRTRWVPALGTPGAYLSPASVRSVVDEHELEARAEEFSAEFIAAYEGFPEYAEILSVDELKIWPEGTAEPR